MIDRLPNTTKALIVCTVAALFYCYEYYLRVAPSVLSAELMESFSISNGRLGLLSAFFYYAYMPSQIPVGLLLDKYGPRIVLTFACLLCVIGIYIFTATNLIWMAQLGRLILGFGSAFAFVGFLKLSSNWLAHRYYALMVGVCTLLGMFGAMGGEIVLAWLIEHMNWQHALELSAGYGLILTVCMWVFIRDNPTKRKQKQQHHVSDAKLFKNLWRDLQNRQIWLIGIIGCLGFLPLSSFAEMWAIPYLLQSGYNKTMAASASAMVFLGFGVGSPLWGSISNWAHSRRKPLIFGTLTGAAMAYLMIMVPHISTFYMFTCLFLLGFFSSAEVLVFAVGNDITAKDSSATTTGIINMIVMFGGIIMQPTVGAILDILHDETIANYQIALLVLPVSLCVAAILSFVLRESFTLN